MNLTTEKELKFEQTLSEHSLQDGYKKTEAGIIPVDWQVKSLTDISHIERGKFSARPRNDPKYFGGIIPFIQTGDISRSNGRNVTFSQTLNEKGLAVSRLFPKNSLYFTIAANIGDVALVDFESACPDSLVVFKEKQNIDKTWLYHALSDKKSEFEVIATSNAQLNINLEKLNPYLLSVPPKEEQTAVANALSDVDALIQELEKLIAKKQAIKTATMQQLLTGRTRLPQFVHHPDGRKKGYKPSELGEIPEDWEVFPFNKIFNYQNGKAQEHLFSSTDGYKVISIGNYSESGKYVETGSYIDKKHAGEISRFVLKTGELAMILNDKTAVGTIIGRVILIDKNDIYVMNQRTMRLSPTEVFNSQYLFALINSEFVHKRIVGMAKPGTQIYINTDDVLEFQVQLPKSMDEQTAIANMHIDMDKEVQTLEQRLAKTRQIKQGMMQELLTGKTRLKS